MGASASAKEVLVKKMAGGSVVAVFVSALPCTSQTAWVPVSTALRPQARSGHALAYDAARQVTLLFGGNAGNSQALGDTWVLGSSGWTLLQPSPAPSPRWSRCMAFDEARGVVVLFGGQTGMSSGWLDDTWEWDGSS